MKSNTKVIGKLEQKDYKIVLPLIKSQNELSVLSVIKGRMPGEVYVNDMENPTAALIQSCECNLIAGECEDKEFNHFIGDQLDFWDAITPDTEAWCEVIPRIHQDKFIRKYIRYRYLLENCDCSIHSPDIPTGYVLEQVIPEKLRKCGYKNAEQIIVWMDNWGDEEAFKKYGVGTYLRKGKTIVSWSLSDCACGKSIAIGIQTDEDYRKKGFAKLVAGETIRQCFRKGYRRIEWLCVEWNKGSVALATSLGFQLNNTYVSYTPYAPIENLMDLTECQWEQWAEYFEQAAIEEPRLYEECIYTYVKANNLQKVKELLRQCEDKGSMEEELNRFAMYLHTMGMASEFKGV